MSQHTEQLIPATSSRAEPRHQPLVLVIDPSETARSVLEVALSRDGFDVWSSASAASALELLKQGRVPDVVVLESDLGGEDGFSFVSQLRGTRATAKVPVLLLARAEDRNVEALAEVVGIDQFIQKPAFVRDVVSLVRLELTRKASPGPMTFGAAQVPPAQLLRALLSCPRSGRLSLAEGRAEVSFRNGRIIDVRFERRGDLDALVRALALTSTSYELSLEPVEGFAEVQITLRELVNTVLPRLARYAQVQARSLPLGSKLVIDFKRLAKAIKSMPDGINQVTQLFDGFRTLQDVLVESPYTETITLEIATRLYLMGVVLPAGGDAGVPALPAPQLFEPKPDEAKSLLHELFDDEDLTPDPEEFPRDQGDWFEEPRGTGLEVLEPSGGWTTGAATDVAHGLPDDLQQQLEAFNIQIEVEAPATTDEARELGSFVRGDAEAKTTALEAALVEATSATPAAPAPVVEAAPIVVEPVPTLAPIRPPKATPLDRPRTGAVPVSASEAVTPRFAQPVVKSVSVEDSFFNDAPTLVEAPPQTEAGVDEATPEPPAAVKKAGPPRWKVGLFAVGLLVAAAVGESFFKAKVVKVTTEVAPIAAPIAPAPVAAAEPETAPEVAAAPDTTVDISDNLTEARKLYESGQYPRAVSVLEQVLSDAPSSTDAWMLMGLVRFDNGNVAAARAAAEKVLSLDAKNARVHILLASIAFDANDREAGKVELQKYLDLDPNGPQAEEARTLLKR